MASQAKGLETDAKRELDEHRGFKAFLTKLGKDNIGMLAAFVSWSLLTSLVPIMVGLIAISSLFLRSPSAQAAVITHLQAAMHGAISRREITTMVQSSIKHSGILALIGFVGVLWGGSSVGGSFSTAFQPIFEVPGRSFIKEKLLDVGMIFVFTALMLVIIAATSAGAILNQLFSGLPLPGITQFVIGTVISLLAAVLLFGAIYVAFPNIKPGFRFNNVWKGALLAAVLFQILTYIWPIYAHFEHFGRYGSVFLPILLLTAWIYFFSIITMLGAEVVAVAAIREAQSEGKSVGPNTNDTVPQHKVLRGGGKSNSDGTRQAGRRQREQSAAADEREINSGGRSNDLERDPAVLLMAATPLLVAVLAAAREVFGRRRTA